MALRKFIAPNLLTCGSVIQFRPATTRSIANVFRTATHFYNDLLHPWAPVRVMSRVLNMMESENIRPIAVEGRWKVWQNTEALLLHRYISKSGKEDVKVSVVDTWNISKNLGPSVAALGLGPPPAAVLVIQCKLVQKLKYQEGDYLDAYTVWIDLQGDLYNINAIKIQEETNRVLKITVPKLKPGHIHKVGIKWHWPGCWCT